MWCSEGCDADEDDPISYCLRILLIRSMGEKWLLFLQLETSVIVPSSVTDQCRPVRIWEANKEDVQNGVTL